MQEFDYRLRPRVIFGPDTIDRLGSLANELKCTRALVVSDPGVVKAGLYNRGESSLRNAGVEVAGFHDLSENPTDLDVEKGLVAAKAFQPNLLIGLGGGSSMDCAKGMNFLYACGGRIQDYWGIGKATQEMLPMIAIPTTAGTGSETQSFALISDSQTHVKMACGDPRVACRIALLDPTLTVTQPRMVTALTGMDAITHALETFVSSKRNPMSECYSREAWQLLAQGFGTVLNQPLDIEARGRMQLGACFAGMAIEASMLGAAHALANPLTATLGIAHGQAVGLMMPHVIRFNGQIMEEQYAQLAKLLPTDLVDNEAISSSEVIARLCGRWLTEASLATTLEDLSQWPPHLRGDPRLTGQMMDELSLAASKQWTASFNPRPTSINDLRSLYANALNESEELPIQ